MKFKIVPVVAGIFLAGTVSASAQDTKYERQVEGYLDQAENQLRDSGYRRAKQVYYDSLSENDEDLLSVNLDSDYDYIIVGACDNDCSDIDMALYDENDNEIDSDNETDSLPILNVSPAWDGEFSISVSMYECSNAPCAYGILIMSR